MEHDSTLYPTYRYRMPATPHNRARCPLTLITSMLSAGAILAASGCSSPIERQSDKELQRAMIRAIEIEVEHAKQNPESRSLSTTLDLTKLEIRDEHLQEIEEQYSVGGYLTDLQSQTPDADDPISALVGQDLMGNTTKLVGLSLEKTIQTAVANNLSVELASFAPAISQSALTQAEAEFDWLFFASAQYQDSIIPQSGSGFGGSTTFVRNASQSADGSVGVSRKLSTGGNLSLSNDINYTNVDSSFFGTPPIPNPANASNITLGVTQQDARQAQVADAVARVERRRSDLLVARSNLRNASDRLKLLMNDPSLPVGSEALIVPREDATSEPISYSLLDAITNAVTNRPEMDIALLSIDDATIRQQVAKNQRLPKLELQAQARLLGFGDSFGDAYNDDDATRFIDDWLLGLRFEQPVGNRIGEAQYRQSRLERMQSVVAYRQTAQSIVLDVKVALNAIVTNNALIAQSNLSRVAQGEALRSLAVEKEFKNLGYSVERLNLELNQQEALANAEISEAAALTNYNNAIVDLHKAMGTTLDRSRIDFVVPDINQLAPGESALDYQVEPATAKPEPTSDPVTEPADD